MRLIIFRNKGEKGVTLRIEVIMLTIKRIMVMALFILLCAPLTQAQTMKDQSFFTPQIWGGNLTHENGWNEEHPRMLADVNGDGRKDVVGFGNDGVWIGLSTGYLFTPIQFALAEFGYNQGWRVSNHVRTMADINGDGKQDIVGFGIHGVWIALSTGAGFGPIQFAVADFGYNQGWRVSKHVRTMADVNGDGRQDIVGFGEDGVWIALSTGAGFGPLQLGMTDFGYNQGWRVSDHVRAMADVNGDGRQDIVGFGIHGVWIALSTGAGFGPMQFGISYFGYNQGWRVSKHVRTMADINGDGRQDIVGFGDDGVRFALSTGVGFNAAQLALSDFGYNQGWRIDRHPRFVADLNADGYLDIVGYGEKAVYRALGGPGGFVGNRMILRTLTAKYSALPPALTPRLLGNVNNDGMQDLVVFTQDLIMVANSSDLPPLPLPEVPTNPRITSKDETRITFAWDDSSNDETGFVISWRKQGENARETEVAKNITSKTFTDLDPDTEYCFNVRAFHLFGEGAETRVVCGRTNPRKEPEPPTNDPQIIVQFGVYLPPWGFGSGSLIISGWWFQPDEQVLLTIIETQEGENPFTKTVQTTADSFGFIKYETLGDSASGVCWPKPRKFEIQATGLATSKKSNIVVTGC